MTRWAKVVWVAAWRGTAAAAAASALSTEKASLANSLVKEELPTANCLLSVVGSWQLIADGGWRMADGRWQLAAGR